MKHVILIFLLLPAFLLSQQSLPEQCIITHPANDRYASYSPSGDRILFESDRSGNWGIYVFEVKTKEVKALFQDSIMRRRPSWSPNGKKIVFEQYKGEHQNKLVEYNWASQTSRTLLEVDQIKGEYLFAFYAPGGQEIVFSLMESPQISNIVTLDITSGKWEKITDFAYRTTYANWSSDGETFLLFSRKDTDNQDDELYFFNLKKRKWKRLTHWPKHNFCPAISPDGKQIAYVTSMEETRPEIYLMNKRGKKQRRITFNENGDTLPRWSPDGKRLLITAYRGGNFEICEIRLKE